MCLIPSGPVLMQYLLLDLFLTVHVLALHVLGSHAGNLTPSIMRPHTLSGRSSHHATVILGWF